VSKSFPALGKQFSKPKKPYALFLALGPNSLNL
jgi:hypothetical protein